MSVLKTSVGACGGVGELHVIGYEAREIQGGNETRSVKCCMNDTKLDNCHFFSVDPSDDFEEGEIDNRHIVSPLVNVSLKTQVPLVISDSHVSDNFSKCDEFRKVKQSANVDCSKGHQTDSKQDFVKEITSTTPGKSLVQTSESKKSYKTKHHYPLLRMDDDVTYHSLDVSHKTISRGLSKSYVSRHGRDCLKHSSRRVSCEKKRCRSPSLKTRRIISKKQADSMDVDLSFSEAASSSHCKHDGQHRKQYGHYDDSHKIQKKSITQHDEKCSSFSSRSDHGQRHSSRRRSRSSMSYKQKHSHPTSLASHSKNLNTNSKGPVSRKLERREQLPRDRRDSHRHRSKSNRRDLLCESSKQVKYKTHYEDRTHRSTYLEEKDRKIVRNVLKDSRELCKTSRDAGRSLNVKYENREKVFVPSKTSRHDDMKQKEVVGLHTSDNFKLRHVVSQTPDVLEVQDPDMTFESSDEEEDEEEFLEKRRRQRELLLKKYKTTCSSTTDQSQESFKNKSKHYVSDVSSLPLASNFQNFCSSIPQEENLLKQNTNHIPSHFKNSSTINEKNNVKTSKTHVSHGNQHGSQISDVWDSESSQPVNKLMLVENNDEAVCLSQQKETNTKDCTFKSVTKCPTVEACNVHVNIKPRVNLYEASCHVHKALENVLSKNFKANSCQSKEAINTTSPPCEVSQKNNLFEEKKLEGSGLANENPFIQSSNCVSPIANNFFINQASLGCVSDISEFTSLGHCNDGVISNFLNSHSFAESLPQFSQLNEPSCSSTSNASDSPRTNQSPTTSSDNVLPFFKTKSTTDANLSQTGSFDLNLLELQQRVQQEKRRLRQFIIMQRETEQRRRESKREVSAKTIIKSDDYMNKNTPIENNLTSLKIQDEDEDIDMFSVSTVNPAIKKPTTVSSCVLSQRLMTKGMTRAEDWDDADGYYLAFIGETIDNGRYRIVANSCGKGVFSSVVSCVDNYDNNRLVAVKIIRHNEMMKRAAQKEADILQRLNAADKEDKRHIVRLYRTFDYKGHVCLAFEWMWGNLRVALKKYGLTGRGLNPHAVHSYTKQLFIGLRHLKKNGILHADLKPDNILLNEKFSILKICDLGSASDVSDNEVTSYLVSRFYRAPEIILGCRYDYSIDVWSAACTLFEIATGQVLFPGISNNDMLKLFTEVKGRIPNRLIRSGQLSSPHFDESFNLLWTDRDAFTKKEIVRSIRDCRPSRILLDTLLDSIPQSIGPTAKATALRSKLRQFADLLEKCLMLDPTKRLTPEEALKHPYLREPMYPAGTLQHMKVASTHSGVSASLNTIGSTQQSGTSVLPSDTTKNAFSAQCQTKDEKSDTIESSHLPLLVANSKSSSPNEKQATHLHVIPEAVGVKVTGTTNDSNE
ncbi:probable serine/threonine-protein kinase dyrk2 isoform X5 [Hylaeus volcanicus]|uniref:probable serine/threonine-protein kinase dyrk2 isoform X5 n=1 Tax=Hylaeus volcanicus TaxID=313075 RepID=UPI0023B7E6E2|nr:probable serine/threonine-protein kinase dyrk2 isoform X5 [Hylaeus volcanicus]